VKPKKPTVAEMVRALRKAGYRSRRFSDEIPSIARWTIGNGVLIRGSSTVGEVRLMSWLAYRELQSGEYKRRLRSRKQGIEGT